MVCLLTLPPVTSEFPTFCTHVKETQCFFPPPENCESLCDRGVARSTSHRYSFSSHHPQVVLDDGPGPFTYKLQHDPLAQCNVGPTLNQHCVSVSFGLVDLPHTLPAMSSCRLLSLEQRIKEC